MNPLLETLTTLSRELGAEHRQLAILGEGNTSADVGDGTFWVKASGSSLGTIEPSGFTRVAFEPVLAALDGPPLADAEVRACLEAARVDPAARLPSVETFLHAVCLREGGARWVGHTHPVSVLGILCSKAGATPFLQHLFPDAIVVCGRHVAVVPYLDPGLQLAVAVRKALHTFREEHGASPKVILLENHGPVVLAQSDREVLQTLLMLDKWARVLALTAAHGGPGYLAETNSDRIETRPDEHYRREAIRNL